MSIFFIFTKREMFLNGLSINQLIWFINEYTALDYWREKN